jgi:AraC family transcriptional regulator, transcriptional activator of pobA
LAQKRIFGLMTPTIELYDAEGYTHRFIESGEMFDRHIRPDYARFFVARVEDMVRLMKLPVPPARITNHTLMYLTEGQATMTIGSEEYTLLKNECLVVPAGQVFSIGNVDLDSGKGYLCSIQNDSIVGKYAKSDILKDFEFFQVWGNPRIRLGGQTSLFVNRLFERIFTDYTENGLGNTDILQPYLVALLCEINGAYVPLSTGKYTSAVGITHRFRDLLFRHVTTKHLVTEYAALLNISPNHLNKSVKAITGKSPTKWIDEAIVLEAKVLLYQSDLSIGEIAAAIGLYDPSYFSRLFRKFEGVSPLQFRRAIGEGGTDRR